MVGRIHLDNSAGHPYAFHFPSNTTEILHKNNHQTMPIDTSKWQVTNTPPPVRRTPQIQAAYDFFFKLEVGSSALIPSDEAATAKNAARQLKKESGDSIEVRFREEGDGKHVRATKIKDVSPEEKARILAENAETPPEAPVPEAAAT